MKNNKPEIWVVLDKDGYPVFTAGWKEACHEHINDAVLHDKSAGKWVVRKMQESFIKTELVLINNIDYIIPLEVACELLRLHLELMAAKKDAALHKWQPVDVLSKLHCFTENHNAYEIRKEVARLINEKLD